MLPVMFKRLYYSIFTKQTIINVFISIFIYTVIMYFDLANIKKLNTFQEFYMLSLMFFIWSFIELLTKKDNYYILFLYLIGFPVQQWFVAKDVLIWVHLNIFLLNYNLLFVGVFFIKIVKEKGWVIRKIDGKFIISIFCCIILSIISIHNATFIYLAVNGVLYGLLVPFVFFLIVVNMLRTEYDVKIMYEVIFINLLFHVVFTFLLEGTDLIFIGFLEERYTGIFGSSLHLAPLVIIFCLISLYNNFYSNRIIYIVAYVIGVYLLLFVGSRGALMCFSIAMILWIFSIPKYNKTLMKFLLVITVSIIVLFNIDIQSILESYKFITLSRAYYKGLDSARYMIWKSTIEYIKNNNLIFMGVGIGNYYYNEIVAWSTSAHSAFLNISSTIGVMGAVLYHYILVSQIRFMSFFTKKNIFFVLPSIILIVLLIYIDIVGYETIYHLREAEKIKSVNTQIETIYLWLILGIAYSVNRIPKNK